MSYHYPLPYKYITESDIMPTLKNMLLCGLTPIGKCLYVFGGGWNDESTAAGTKAKTGVGVNCKIHLHIQIFIKQKVKYAHNGNSAIITFQFNIIFYNNDFLKGIFCL